MALSVITIALAVLAFACPGCDSSGASDRKTPTEIAFASGNRPDANTGQAPIQQPMARSLNHRTDPNKHDDTKVIAYYFHGTIRCVTCLWVEQNAQRIIMEDFAEALNNGKLTWQAINFDQGANRHYLDRFKLTTSAMILALQSNGKVVAWKKLDKVWQLAQDPQAFAEYLRSEITAYLDHRNGGLPPAAD